MHEDPWSLIAASFITDYCSVYQNWPVLQDAFDSDLSLVALFVHSHFVHPAVSFDSSFGRCDKGWGLGRYSNLPLTTEKPATESIPEIGSSLAQAQLWIQSHSSSMLSLWFACLFQSPCFTLLCIQCERYWHSQAFLFSTFSIIFQPFSQFFGFW